MGLSEYGSAIEKLQDATHLKLHQAELTRVDVGNNINTLHEPRLYFPYLGESRNYQRAQIDSSVYWKNGHVEVVMYDKVRELKSTARKEGVRVQQTLDHTMRIEVRYKQRLCNRFNRPEVVLGSLVEPDFYLDLHNRWKSEYEAIQKINTMEGLPKLLPSTPKEGINAFTIYGLMQMGLDNALHVVEVWKANGAFKRKEEYSRLKRMIKELYGSPNLTIESKLIKELNDKVQNTNVYL
jgi:hypothetical protein